MDLLFIIYFEEMISFLCCRLSETWTEEVFFCVPDEDDLSLVTILSCFNYLLLYKMVSCLLAASCTDSHFYLYIISLVILKSAPALKVEINQISLWGWYIYSLGFLRAIHASDTLYLTLQWLTKIYWKVPHLISCFSWFKCMTIFQ